MSGQFTNMGQFSVSASVNQKLAHQVLFKQQQIMQMKQRLEFESSNQDLTAVSHGQIHPDMLVQNMISY